MKLNRLLDTVMVANRRGSNMGMMSELQDSMSSELGDGTINAEDRWALTKVRGGYIPGGVNATINTSLVEYVSDWMAEDSGQRREVIEVETVANLAISVDLVTGRDFVFEQGLHLRNKQYKCQGAIRAFLNRKIRPVETFHGTPEVFDVECLDIVELGEYHEICEEIRLLAERRAADASVDSEALLAA